MLYEEVLEEVKTVRRELEGKGEMSEEAVRRIRGESA